MITPIDNPENPGSTCEQVDWKRGAKAVVSLTYDDGLRHHWAVVSPQLTERGFTATFYAPIQSDLIRNPEGWRSLAQNGHEIGNHTIFHPCRKEGGLADFPWLDDWRDLRNYTLNRWAEEVQTANGVLSIIDQRQSRSYGNTCHHEDVGRDDLNVPEIEKISLLPVIREYFSAARGPARRQIIQPDHKDGCDLASLGCYSADNRNLEDLVAEIDEAISLGGWIIYCMHGVGPEEHDLHIDANVHEQLLNHLASLGDEIRVASVNEVASHVANSRGEFRKP